jgi:hypothetical protein
MGLDGPTDDRTDGGRAGEHDPGEDRTAGSPRPAPDPLADADAGVAVDDDPGQVDLNVDQWDSE